MLPPLPPFPGIPVVTIPGLLVVFVVVLFGGGVPPPLVPVPVPVPVPLPAPRAMLLPAALKRPRMLSRRNVSAAIVPSETTTMISAYSTSP